MKTVILAGGLGTRLLEETTVRPKPMVDVGGWPLLWHIMNIYAHHGFESFVVALGYKGEMIKEYFLEYYTRGCNLTVHLGTGESKLHKNGQPKWKIDLIDTGRQTATGGRVKRLERYLESEQTFMLTYGDGVGNVDLTSLVAFHRSHGRLATVTAVRPPARFGALLLDGPRVASFAEKPQAGEGWINGGFFVLERDVLDYIPDDNTAFEGTPLNTLAREGQLMAYEHRGFWHPMDTLRERNLLDELWNTGRAPWKVW